MNYIKHLTAFFDKVLRERDLNPSHISLYMALFQFWNLSRFQNPICISRDDVMSISKIGSKSTYHKCMKELHEMEFIIYDPSYNPFKGSMVTINTFPEDSQTFQKKVSNNIKNDSVTGQVIGQALDKSCTGTGTSTEQALVSSINKINKINISKIVNEDGHQNEIENDLQVSENRNKGSQKNSAKKETSIPHPSINEVLEYFQSESFPEIEAQKFFNYFASTGWLVGGRTPMVDWHPAAQNWILNAPKFHHHDERSDRAKHLNSPTDKDYSEPL